MNQRKMVLIRHGKTSGNLQGRYIGCRTDESLCALGIEELKQRSYPAVSRVVVSPMKRCLETAAILYPHLTPEVIDDFRECDFGAFENLHYAQLNGREDYQRWIDSGGELPFPGGESRSAFALRCVRAFDGLHPDTDCALIVHGGTIMAIMEAYATPKGHFYDFQVKNGLGYILREDGTYTMLPLGVAKKQVDDQP